jgi:hypothetical protein
MANFAVLNNDLIVNIIVCDSKEVAEAVTGLTCVEYTNEIVHIGGTYTDGKFNEPITE